MMWLDVIIAAVAVAFLYVFYKGADDESDE